MKVLYDPEHDLLQITFIDTIVQETAQIAPGIVLDYDIDGNPIGLELRKASTRVDRPYAISYLVGEANFDKPQLNHDDLASQVMAVPQSLLHDSCPTKSVM